MNFDKLYKDNPDVYGNKPSAWIVKIFKYLPNARRVLDLGICYGRNAIYLATKGCEVEGVDISKVAIDQCLKKADKNKVKIKCYQQDIKEFNFKGKYDVIFSTMSLQYLEKEETAENIIKKMKSHTNEGGLNILSVPTNTKIAMKMPFYFDK